jgi:hypothetical protein
LTDFDVDKFIKDFKAFDKEQNINEDFDEDWTNYNWHN